MDFLLKCFVFLGPIGTLLTPSFLPLSFRIYYLILLAFPFSLVRMDERHFKIALYSLPFFFYCFCSAFYSEFYGITNEPFPLFRFFLLFCQFFFVLGTASSNREEKKDVQILQIYLNGFFLSLLFGYILFIGHFLHYFPLDFIRKFVIEPQFSVHYMIRFSPGSTANEYGIISSFVLSILTLALSKGDYLGKTRSFICIYFALTAAALLLTTTRAAYIAYLLSLIYISWKSEEKWRTFSRSISWVAGTTALLIALKVDLFLIFLIGFAQNVSQGTIGARMEFWLSCFDQFKDHILLGTGFASMTNLHNVYLQLLFELGLVGMALLALMGGAIFIEGVFRSSKQKGDFLTLVRQLGIFHVLWFACSNHNLNQHFSWLVAFLVLSSLGYSRQKSARSTLQTG